MINDIIISKIIILVILSEEQIHFLLDSITEQRISGQILRLLAYASWGSFFSFGDTNLLDAPKKWLNIEIRCFALLHFDNRISMQTLYPVPAKVWS